MVCLLTHCYYDKSYKRKQLFVLTIERLKFTFSFFEPSHQLYGKLKSHTF